MFASQPTVGLSSRERGLGRSRRTRSAMPAPASLPVAYALAMSSELHAPADLLTAAWSLMPGAAEIEAGSCEFVPPSAPVRSAYPIATVAAASVGAASLAAVGAGIARRGGSGGPPEPISVDVGHALADWRGHVAVDGEAVPAWAPLSGRYRAAGDRFVQLHCNFPHHAAGAAAVLGVGEDRAAFETAIASRDPFELEEAMRTAGMICAAYRTPAEWDTHPHALATADLPLLTVDRLGDAPPRADVGPADAEPVDRALDGLRVLDCSRVLAGPVCGRTLAAHGADVLRVGARHLPSVEVGVIATGFGKRNAYVDLDTEAGVERFTGLVTSADVFVDAYRPGALAERGFAAERAAELNPGIVVVEICAFDWQGPWAQRRGYDSIVQSTTGIALGQAALVDSEEPVHLPMQALDFATGYLAAFAAAGLVAEQARSGGSWRARLSLLRTRNWLAGIRTPELFEPGPPPPVEPYLHDVASPFGTVSAVRPVAGRWDRPPAPLGSSEPVWLSSVDTA